MTIQSTMQHGQLGVAQLLRQALRFGIGSNVISHNKDGITKTQLKACANRAARLGAAIVGYGLNRGDVVATLCNTDVEHFEAYLGIPAFGVLLHPLNIRMHDSDLADMVCEIEDRVLIVSRTNLDRFKKLAPLLTRSKLQLVLVTGNGPVVPIEGLSFEIMSYEDFISDISAPEPDELFDQEETQAAAICHTGGTTGQPKTVVYSHRSVWLQAQSLTCANSLALSREDTLLAAVPLYHVNGWGLPFATTMANTDLVLPGDNFHPELLNTLIENCGVTIAAGVPTIWNDLLKFREMKDAGSFKTLTRLATGGAVVPDTLVEAMLNRNVEVVQAWGMTETSSMSVVGRLSPAGVEGDRKVHKPIGFPSAGLELRVVTSNGEVLTPGSAQSGEIQIRGAYVTSCYHGVESTASFDGGWLRTGDIGMLDELGQLILTDRLKDAIKSGGEWIATPILENALCSLPGITDAAVIAVPDDRFQERPLAVTVCENGKLPDMSSFRDRLSQLVPSWWIPDGWAVLPSIPLTGLGKPDKAALRSLNEKGALEIHHMSSPKPTNKSSDQPETAHDK